MKKFAPLYILLFILFTACKEEELSISDSFLKIYDDKDYNAEYKPTGLGITDSTIIVIAERSTNSSDFAGIKLVLTNSKGDFISSTDIEEQYVAATKELIKIGSSHYFFCMNKNTLRPYLGIINSLGDINFIATDLNNSYPLAASKNNQNELILLSYHQENKTSDISIISTSGSTNNSASYTIGAGNDVLESIISHFTESDQKIPFFCGQAPDQKYYFNAFYNYTLSTVFTNLGDDPVGVIQGQAAQAGMKSFHPVEGNQYAFVAFQFDNTYISPYIQLNTSEISSTINYLDRKLPEIKKGSRTKILPYQFEGTNLTIIAAETEGRQLILYFYEATSGQLLNTYLVGTLNPFSFSDMVVSEDGHLIIAGSTFLADRFERVFIQKIGRKQILDII